MNLNSLPGSSRIAHLSDLHFGTVLPEMCARLLDAMETAEPDVVVISGDLTQRATPLQFREAAAFLKKLRFPKVVVPGNHDIPLWNLYRRFFSPLKAYRKAVDSDVEPGYKNDRLVIMGINSARSLEWKEGRISLRQIRRIESEFVDATPSVFKVVVMHHPLIPCFEGNRFHVVKRADKALNTMITAGIDLVLTGHLHHQYACQSVHKRALLAIQAGTALSNRTRDTLNSFNIIDITANDHVKLTVHEWEAGGRKFHAVKSIIFRERGLWIMESSEKKTKHEKIDSCGFQSRCGDGSDI